LNCVSAHIIICCIAGATLLFTGKVHAASAPQLAKDSVARSSGKNIIQAKDTARSVGLPKEYQSLKQQSSKNRWTKRLFSLLIREARPPGKSDEKESMVDEYKTFEGKIVRNINIKVLSPFGTNIKDPDYITEDLNVFNNLHVLTRESTIKSIIQFKRGSPVNPALLAESEAQLRSTNYINDARIIIIPPQQESDSVDINIIVRDKWTIGVDLHGLSSSIVDIEVFDKNILGTGSRVGLNFIHSTEASRRFGYGGNYLYENIARKNIDLEGSYLDDIWSQETSVSLTRRLQPKLNYFGEISYTKKTLRTDILKWDSISPDHNEKFSATLGRAFTLSNENAIRRLVVGFRYKLKKPEYRNMDYQNHMKDVLLPYKNTKNQIWLMQLSLYQNSYKREYMVYNFGTTEDIASGYNLSMQLGYSKFDDLKKEGLYSSFSASYGGDKFIKGNVYVSSAISSFFDKGTPFQSVFKFDARYFTPLRKLSSLRFRQFITLSYSKLLTPDRYLGDQIYMGQNTTLKMRNWRTDRKGAEQLIIKSETDVFSNYEVAGFRCLFYNFLDLGWITPRGNLFKGDNLNYGIGLGIRLRNNFVILNTIDLKIGFYPKLNQSGFNNFFQVRSSTPSVPPNFEPRLPDEIVLE